MASYHVPRSMWIVFIVGLFSMVDALVDYPALAGLPHSLAQVAACSASRGAVFPEVYYDEEGIFGGGDKRIATFAGGCFWGLELAYQRQVGVLATCVGFTQGQTEFPSYSEVCKETTGHTEAVLLLYDCSIVSYAALAVLLFDRIGDPTMLNRVGNDRGKQYRTGMYYHSAEQEVEARAAFDREGAGWRSSGRKVVTEVLPAEVFWPAEEVHQRFLEKGNGRSGQPQSAAKGATDTIRCYG